MDLHPKTEPGLRPPPGFSSSYKSNVDNNSVSELVSTLRVAFRFDEFDSVEKVLVARDASLKAEIASLQVKIEVERLNKIQAEEELKKKEEHCQKGERARELYEKLLKEVKESELVNMKTIKELRDKNYELFAENWKFKESEKKWEDERVEVEAGKKNREDEKIAMDKLRRRNNELEDELKNDKGVIDELRAVNTRLLDEKQRLKALVESKERKMNKDAPGASGETSNPRPTGGARFDPAVQSTWGNVSMPTPSPTSHDQGRAATDLVYQFIPTPGFCDTARDETQPPSDHEGGDDDHDADHLDDLQMDEDTADVASDGRTVIRPVGRGWTPGKPAATAINRAIRMQFRAPSHSWSSASDETRAYWWTRFQDTITWDPAHDAQIRSIFVQRCTKRLTDMMTKARKKGTRPNWIGEEACEGLLTYWASPEFVQKSDRNRANRASTRGGAVHTSGRKAHVDVALELETQLGQSVDPGDLFLVTHRRNTWQWIDTRSHHTYESYQARLKEVVSQAESTPGSQPVDVAQKMQIWRDVSGGMTRGRCYGIADLSANVRHRVPTLIQESVAPSHHHSRSKNSVDRRAAKAEAEKLLTGSGEWKAPKAKLQELEELNEMNSHACNAGSDPFQRNQDTRKVNKNAPGASGTGKSGLVPNSTIIMISDSEDEDNEDDETHRRQQKNFSSMQTIERLSRKISFSDISSYSSDIPSHCYKKRKRG